MEVVAVVIWRSDLDKYEGTYVLGRVIVFDSWEGATALLFSRLVSQKVQDFGTGSTIWP
jgi:hypothetical protein